MIFLTIPIVQIVTLTAPLTPVSGTLESIDLVESGLRINVKRVNVVLNEYDTVFWTFYVSPGVLEGAERDESVLIEVNIEELRKHHEGMQTFGLTVGGIEFRGRRQDIVRTTAITVILPILLVGLAFLVLVRRSRMS